MTYYLLKENAEVRIPNIFKLKRMYEAAAVNAADVVRRDGATGWRTVGDTLGLSSGFSAGRVWKNPLPSPPPVSWWVTLILGAVTFGYATYIVGAIQAFWSRRVERRWAPVSLAIISVLTPPVHLFWIFRSIMQGRHDIREAIIDLVVGFIAAEIAAGVFTSLGSLSIRRSLMRKLEQSGFRMSWILTAFFGPIYVAYVVDELRHSFR